MSPAAQFAGQLIRATIDALVLIVLWAVWIALAVLFLFQIYIVSTNELPVPRFLLQQLEQRLAESGLLITFERTLFDPTGRILMEEARVALPAYNEPVLHARGVYVGLNPWYLAMGRLEPDEIRIIGATARVPALLSGSGAPEEIVRDVEATLFPSRRRVDVAQLSARVAGIAVTVHGALPLPRRQPDVPRWFTVDTVQQHFPRVARQLMAWREELENFREPFLEVNLTPSESGAAQFHVVFRTRGLSLEAPVALTAENVELSTIVRMVDGAPAISRIDAVARELRLPHDVTARRVHASVFGRLNLVENQFEPREITLTADAAQVGGIAAHGIAAQLLPRPLPRLDASLVARVADSELALRAEADLDARKGTLRFQGSIAPAVLDIVGQYTGVDVRRFFDFAALECADAELRLGSGWTFERLEADVALREIQAYGVMFEEGRAAVVLDRERFHSPRAYGRVGTNIARGTYEQDLASGDYRFLLDGELRPLDIAPWFREWWRNFFAQFDFAAAAPVASVDVRGKWGDGRQASVFVRADAAGPVIRGAAFDRVHTRLFLRPGYFDGLAVHGTQGERRVAGTFTYNTRTATALWRSFEVNLDSSLELATAARIIGPAGEAMLAPFAVAAPPEVRLRGRFDGPGSPDGRQHDVRIDARTAGEFRFHEFPLQDVSFTAFLRNDEVLVEDIRGGFAGGTTSGRVRVWTAPGGGRRLGFETMLKDAALGRVAAAMEQFFAHKHNRAPEPPGKFVQEKAAVRMDLTATAEGNYNQPYSYAGSGITALRGAEIGEVPLLGALSELFTFTALRFNSARATFSINGPRLVFSEFALRGANSAIDAYGDYAFDRHELDFKAKIFPFQESGGLIRSVVGAVLTPISNVLEVKLTGTMAKPQWAFVLGPTSFLRALAPTSEAAERGDPLPSDQAVPTDPPAGSPPPPLP
jgi:hypothetical protein